MIKRIKIKRKRIRKRPKPVKTPTMPLQKGIIVPNIGPRPVKIPVDRQISL